MANKLTFKILMLAFVFSIGGCITSQITAHEQNSYQVFYDNLSPYGNWIDNPQYGYVWAPNVSQNFTPYSSNGYWLSTEYGWTWVSNYSWGWAPFHYGRWYYDSNYGWLWMPGNQWSPAWVVWRSSPNYYGWAPMGPGVSMDYGYSNNYNVPSNNWRFVRDRDFGRRDMDNYYINSSNNGTIINNSTVINNFHEDRTRNVRYNGGPDRNEVEKKVGRTFAPLPVREDTRPGENIRSDQFKIYRPIIQQNNTTGTRPVPSRITNVRDLKPVNERNGLPRQPGYEEQNGNLPNRQQPNSNGQSNQQRQYEPPVRLQPKLNELNNPPQQNNQQGREQPKLNVPNNPQQQNEPPVRQQPKLNLPGNTPQQNEQPVRQQPRLNVPNNPQQQNKPLVRLRNDQQQQRGKPENEQPSAPQTNTQVPARIQKMRQEQRAKQEQERLPANTDQQMQKQSAPAQTNTPNTQQPVRREQLNNNGDQLEKLNQRQSNKADPSGEKKE